MIFLRLSQDKLKKLQKIFKNSTQVLVVYLFGSQTKNFITSLSDIDLAVLTKNSLSLDEKATLIGDITTALETDNLDFVLLNEATSIILKSRIIEGKVLYSTDEKERIRFETKIMSEYLFLKPFINFYDQCFLREVKKEYGVRQRSY